MAFLLAFSPPPDPVGASALRLLEHGLHGRITEIVEELAAMDSQDCPQGSGNSPLASLGLQDGWMGSFLPLSPGHSPEAPPDSVAIRAFYLGDTGNNQIQVHVNASGP